MPDDSGQGPLPPPPPPSETVRAPLSEDQERARLRLRWWLLLVPFTFPMWFRLRREDPGLAATLRLELAVCVFNSLLVVLLGCCLVSLAVFRQQLIVWLTKVVIDTGIVR